MLSEIELRLAEYMAMDAFLEGYYECIVNLQKGTLPLFSYDLAWAKKQVKDHHDERWRRYRMLADNEAAAEEEVKE
jgi:uncharacterized protein with von Willebrand factor type A (vWA) domain